MIGIPDVSIFKNFSRFQTSAIYIHLYPEYGTILVLFSQPLVFPQAFGGAALGLLGCQAATRCGAERPAGDQWTHREAEDGALAIPG